MSERANTIALTGRTSGPAVWAGRLAGRLLRPLLARALAGRVARGAIRFDLPDGRSIHAKGAETGPFARIRVKDWRALARLVTGGGLGLARGYIAGDWDSPDLVKVIEFGAANRNALDRTLKGNRLARWRARRAHARRANTREGAKTNIAYHYDLGNDFYAAWLDPSMTYSSALFGRDTRDLHAAQVNKYRSLLSLLQAKEGQHVLEIGCGWGGFAEVAAKEAGVQVTGLSLSDEQLKYARKRMKDANLANAVQLKKQDYRDTEGQFDHIVSIEMFEAVGEAYWSTYFEKIRDCLKTGGRAALQIITIDPDGFEAYRRNADFIQAYIFPGGMLPTLDILKDKVREAGLTWKSSFPMKEHYARTLATWRLRFHKARREGRLPAGFDDTFRRLWDYYLAYCEGGFRQGAIDVHQILIEKRA